MKKEKEAVQIELPEEEDRTTEYEVAAALGGLSPSEALVARMVNLTAWADRFSLTVDGEVYELSASEQVSYDPADLSRALREQAGKVAWWGALIAKLARIAAEAKGRASLLRAALAVEIRSGHRVIPGGKVTESLVKEVVDADPQVIMAERLIVEAQEKLDTARAVMEALKHRREMLYLEGLLTNTEMRSIGLTTRRNN